MAEEAEEAEEAAEERSVVVLGFDAAWGYAPADQTSPALAGAAGALIDTTMTGERVTELRRAQRTCCCRTGWDGTGRGPPGGGSRWPWRSRD
jgi:hypothetical protein